MDLDGEDLTLFKILANQNRVDFASSEIGSPTKLVEMEQCLDGVMSPTPSSVNLLHNFVTTDKPSSVEIEDITDDVTQELNVASPRIGEDADLTNEASSGLVDHQEPTTNENKQTSEIGGTDSDLLIHESELSGRSLFVPKNVNEIQDNKTKKSKKKERHRLREDRKGARLPPVQEEEEVVGSELRHENTKSEEIKPLEDFANETFDYEPSSEELEAEKQQLLFDLHQMKKFNVTPSKHYDMNSNVDEIRFELKRQLHAMEEDKTVKWMKDALRMGCTGIEMMNQKVGPFLQLDGWADEISQEISMVKYDSVMTRLYKKYFNRKSTMSPEAELVMALSTSIAMHHFKNKMTGPRNPMTAKSEIKKPPFAGAKQTPLKKGPPPAPPKVTKRKMQYKGNGSLL